MVKKGIKDDFNSIDLRVIYSKYSEDPLRVETGRDPARGVDVITELGNTF